MIEHNGCSCGSGVAPTRGNNPTDGVFRRITAHPVSVLQTLRSDDAIQTLTRRLTTRNPRGLRQDERLQTALELYGTHYTENSQRAKFLTLVMVLEALAQPTPRPAQVLEFLGSMNQTIEMRIAEFDEDSEEATAFAALRQEIGFRRHDPIRSQVRALVLRTLANDSNAREIADEALRIYDLRSRLVHDGYLEESVLNEATNTAKNTAQRILIALFESATLPGSV